MLIAKLFNNNKTPAVTAGVLLFSLLQVNIVSAQSSMTLNDFEHNAIFTDMNGKAFTNPDIDVAGTRFFMEAWKYGKIKVNDNTQFGNIRLRLDVKNQEVHFLKSDNVEMVAPAGSIKEIAIIDSAGVQPVTYTFQCGFPAIDNQHETNFYQLLCNGKIKLLKSTRKIIHQDKDDLSGEIKKEFRTYEDYYLYSVISMLRIKKDKAYILDLMANQKDKIEEYTKANNLGYKSIDDLRKIIDYYNSLP
jgi:hypothetical protein